MEKLDPILMEVDGAAINSAVKYVVEILQMAGYGDSSTRIAYTLIHGFPEHESDIDFDAAKDLGLRVRDHVEDAHSQKVWRVMRAWLGSYIFEASGVHIIRYAIPGGQK